MIIPDKHRWSRWLLGFLALALMIALYIFQRQLLWFPNVGQGKAYEYVPFILNRSMRLILNDVLCLVMFVAIFNGTKEVKLASVIVMIELFLILPVYLVVKLSMEGDSEISTPLLSFIHRLIVNPLLMMILLVGLLYQKYRIMNH